MFSQNFIFLQFVYFFFCNFLFMIYLILDSIYRFPPHYTIIAIIILLLAIFLPNSIYEIYYKVKEKTREKSLFDYLAKEENDEYSKLESAWLDEIENIEGFPDNTSDKLEEIEQKMKEIRNIGEERMLSKLNDNNREQD